MTKWILAKELKAASFRRLTGVKRTTFERMLEILRVAEIKKNVEGVVRTRSSSKIDS